MAEKAVAQALQGLRPEQLAALGDAIQLVQSGRRQEDIAAIDTGDTAFILICTCLVLMMTIPGLALFYGGLSQAPNVLATVMHSFSITCLVTILWLLFGYSMSFDPGNPVIGGSGSLFFGGLPFVGGTEEKPIVINPVMAKVSGTIPESLFFTFQCTFAVITAAIITGSFAERVRFGPMLIFIGIWHLLVYCPLCHWEWGGGFMSSWHVLDFAGGDVVHISSGVSGLAASLVVGKRKGFGQGAELPPHNILLVFMGASLLWVGWFGFNAGSAVAAGQSAGMAMMVTHVSACAGGLSWMCLEWILKGKPSVLGTVSGAVAGLVVVTPGSGFVDHFGAILCGITAGPVCYFGIQIKHMCGFDDALDAFGVHGIGGIWGGIMTGLLANPAIAGESGAFYGNGRQLGIQIAGIVTTMAYSFVMTLLIIIPLDFLLKAITGKGMRVTEEAEDIGLDISEHGESMMGHVAGPHDVTKFDASTKGHDVITTIQVGDAS